MNNNEERNDAINPSITERKTQSFNLIIGIATLLIAIFGATFAYFTATARSNEGEITVKSAMVSINFDRGTEIKANNLIPSAQSVVLHKYQKDTIPFVPGEGEEYIQDYDEYVNENQNPDLSPYLDRKCIDGNGREVCYVFWFSVKSDGEVGGTTDILSYITVDRNEFQNLSYLVYEVEYNLDENQSRLKDKYGFGVVNSYTLVSHFDAGDSTSDDIPFAYFGRVQDILDEHDNITGVLHPVACLFGEKENAATLALDDVSRCSAATISNAVEHNYQVLIWLNETGHEQLEQGKTFQGTIAVETVGDGSSGEGNGGRITGQD